MMLIDSPLPELQIGLRLILPITLGMAGIIAVPRPAGASRRSARPPVTGTAGMLDEVGHALTPIEPGGSGRVRTHGEIWTATADEPIEQAHGRVTAVNGLTLRVRQQAHQTLSA